MKLLIVLLSLQLFTLSVDASQRLFEDPVPENAVAELHANDAGIDGEKMVGGYYPRQLKDCGGLRSVNRPKKQFCDCRKKGVTLRASSQAGEIRLQFGYYCIQWSKNFSRIRWKCDGQGYSYAWHGSLNSRFTKYHYKEQKKCGCPGWRCRKSGRFTWWPMKTSRRSLEEGVEEEQANGENMGSSVQDVMEEEDDDHDDFWCEYCENKYPDCVKNSGCDPDDEDCEDMACKQEEIDDMMCKLEKCDGSVCVAEARESMTCTLEAELNPLICPRGHTLGPFPNDNDRHIDENERLCLEMHCGALTTKYEACERAAYIMTEEGDDEGAEVKQSDEEIEVSVGEGIDISNNMNTEPSTFIKNIYVIPLLFFTMGVITTIAYNGYKQNGKMINKHFTLLDDSSLEI